MSQSGTYGGSGGNINNLIFGLDIGSTTPVAGEIDFLALNNLGQTPRFRTFNPGQILLTGSDGQNNTLIGGGGNVGAGINNADSNSGLGYLCLSNLHNSDNNSAFGYHSLASIDLGALVPGDGSNNSALGYSTLSALINGAYNIGIGASAGINYTSNESSNICINNAGTVAESNTLRIGSATGSGNQQLNRAFIQGIYNITPAQPNPFFVVIDSNGQLGATTDSGEIATSFPTDSGTATPAAGVLNIIGDSSAIVTSGTGNTVTIHYNPLLTTVSTTPYAVTNIDYYIAVDASGSAITINMPNSTTTGRQFTVKDYLGQANINNIFITTLSGTVLFDGFPTYTMSVQYEAVNLVFDGTNYQLF